MVFQAYKKVKANKGAAGIDQMSWDYLDNNLKMNSTNYGTGSPQAVIFRCR
jgi:hypothetical protein